MNRLFIMAGIVTMLAQVTTAQAVPDNEGTHLIKYGDMNQWVTRQVKESAIIGGNMKTLHEIAPTKTWAQNAPYTNWGGSPWGTSNVMAKVSGITKTNVSVYRDEHPGHGSCAKLVTHIETCKVLGIVNIKVLAAGSIFLGQTLEPITSTSNPMAKLNAGMKFTGRPKACLLYTSPSPRDA